MNRNDGNYYVSSTCQESDANGEFGHENDNDNSDFSLDPPKSSTAAVQTSLAPTSRLLSSRGGNVVEKKQRATFKTRSIRRLH